MFKFVKISFLKIYSFLSLINKVIYAFTIKPKKIWCQEMFKYSFYFSFGT